MSQDEQNQNQPRERVVRLLRWNPRWSGFVGLLAAIAFALGTSSVDVREPDALEPMRYGIPHSSDARADVLRLWNHGFVVGYSEERVNPLWVAYRVFCTDFSTGVGRQPWKTDHRTRSQVTAADFTNTGYDRGHMAPNATIAHCYGSSGQADTFLMSNVCPQIPTLNQGVWKSLEVKVRQFAVAFEEVWIFAGPVFDEEVELLTRESVESPAEREIEIPDAFYKIVIDELGSTRIPRVLAFLVPEDPGENTALEEYLVSVDAVEEVTGIDFLVELDNELEEVLESATASEVWEVEDT